MRRIYAVPVRTLRDFSVSTLTAGLVASLVGLSSSSTSSLLWLAPTIGSNLTSAVHDETTREAALLTFLVTLSGVTVGKIGSPLWGALAGGVALAASRWPRRQRTRQQR